MDNETDLTEVFRFFSSIVLGRSQLADGMIGRLVNAELGDWVTETFSVERGKKITKYEAWLAYFKVLAGPFPLVFGDYLGWRDHDGALIRTNVSNAWSVSQTNKRPEAIGAYLYSHIGGKYAEPLAARNIDLKILGTSFERCFGFSPPATVDQVHRAQEILLQHDFRSEVQPAPSTAPNRNSHKSQDLKHEDWRPSLYLPERQPHASQVGLSQYNSAGRFRYDRRETSLVGRTRAQRALHQFADSDKPFSWVQIAGEAGQGKSRLALEFAYALKDRGWNAGFLLTEEFDDFQNNVGTWQPSEPTLIIVDYVLGFEIEMGKLLRSVITRGSTSCPAALRLIILERQRWDTASMLPCQESSDGQIALQPRLGRAEWFGAMHSAPRGSTLGYQPDVSRYSEPAIELAGLNREDLVRVVRDYSPKPIALSDDVIWQTLKKLDPSGRPLFALFLSETLAHGQAADAQHWTAQNLLDHILTRNQMARWSHYFDEARPDIGANTPSMRGAILAQLCGGLSKQEMRRHLRSDYSPEILRQILALLDAPIALSASEGFGSYIPKLQPDILGDWMIISAVRNGLEFNGSLMAAWAFAPDMVVAFLKRLVTTFSIDDAIIELLATEPQDDNARLAYRAAIPELIGHLIEWTALNPNMDLNPTKSLFQTLQELAKSELDRGAAKNVLGYCYWSGWNCDQSDKRALEWFERGSKQSHEQSLTNLAICYFEGIGTPINPEIAIQTLRCTHLTGYPPALRVLGSSYLRGEGADRSIFKGLRTLHRAARLGDAIAMRLIGTQYLKFSKRKRIQSLGRAWHEHSANAGDVIAMYLCGLQCLRERGRGQRSNSKATAWFELAASRDHLPSMVQLAFCLQAGDESRKPDAASANHILYKAAERGFVPAMLAYARNLLSGTGFDEPAPREANDWLRRCDKLDCIPAIRLLAHNLMNGIGVSSPDLSQAEDLLERADKLQQCQDVP